MIALTGNSIFGNRILIQLQKKGIKSIFIEPDMGLRNFKKEISSNKIIHFVASPTVSMALTKLIISKILGKKTLVTWIGFDVRHTKYSKIRNLTTRFGKYFIDFNTATSKNLVNDLKAVGIAAKYQPIPVYSLFQISNLPKEKKIAIYLPDRNPADWELYQGKLIKKIIDVFSDVEFLVLGNSGKNFTEKNVKCIPWTENIGDIYKQVKAVIRLPLEDGTSGTVLETLSMGRTMIASNTLVPFCRNIKNFEEAKIAVVEVLEKNTLNIEGSKYVHDNFSNLKLTEDLIEIYQSLTNDTIFQ